MWGVRFPFRIENWSFLLNLFSNLSFLAAVLEVVVDSETDFTGKDFCFVDLVGW